MADIKCVRARITGVVQGVSFRYHTQETANLHGVNGWVRNMPDGSVEAVFQGDPKAVKAVLDWCWIGPSFARVDDVVIQDEPADEEFSSFRIAY
ncbi:acylphosphatase [Desulfatibacillum aliphaticivorans]|jgi:acylphosphatase|uniref:Acylphosphatase n=2 Tax=Desulfatibacillum TaxID=218207 RepID=B8FMQ4_DESAL|nr:MULTISPECIES: acylphosphatase [Desulfatibacillum]ACL01921.1 acylphosphatase [Desulfatibacillum aliphaticivorans]SHJ38908.1 acylphosphatase [Desulfatibacillum alkenivorans DSM 16219]